MRASPEHSDEELLRLTAAGDADAFAALYRRRQAGIYRFALQMCGSEGIAEDVTQEVFMTLVRDSQTFDPTRGALASYLYGVARNQVLRRLEKERHFVAMADETAEDGDAIVSTHLVAADDPLAELARSELIETVRQAVLALPVHYREVVVLCELHEMSYAEAATALGCAVGTVRSRLHRARALLVERLREVRQRDAAATTDFDPLRCFA
ncbi:MAG: RNA polymerase sigma factor [Acidobacteria bacterium]|nr:RNA polymerase sigma factor [Acidobacteriota bacterium]